MSRQEFGVVFNTDPSRPIGTIDGFRQKGREGIVPPSRMQDVLDDETSVHIRGQEYVIDETGSVIGAGTAEEIAAKPRFSGETATFAIGEGVFIAEGVHFNMGIAGDEEYLIRDGSAIGHRFRADGSSPADTAGTSWGAPPAANRQEAEEMITFSLEHADTQTALSIAAPIMVGKSAVLWCAVAEPETTIGHHVIIQDEAQVFATAAIGSMTRFAPGTIVNPSRGLIGSHLVFEPGGERENKANMFLGNWIDDAPGSLTAKG